MKNSATAQGGSALADNSSSQITYDFLGLAPGIQHRLPPIISLDEAKPSPLTKSLRIKCLSFMDEFESAANDGRERHVDGVLFGYLVHATRRMRAESIVVRRDA